MRLHKKAYLLVFLFSLFVFIHPLTAIAGVDLSFVLSRVDDVRLEFVINRPAVMLGILAQESFFSANPGSNAGSPKANIQRCVDFCSRFTYGTCCVESRSYRQKSSECLYQSKFGREAWCSHQQDTLKTICDINSLDVNQVNIANDYGMGAAQFQPITWNGYEVLKSKNPWDPYDAIFGLGFKLTHQNNNINFNERAALVEYNGSDDYPNKVLPRAGNWEHRFDRVIAIYNKSCGTQNKFTCALPELIELSQGCGTSEPCLDGKIDQAVKERIKPISAEEAKKKLEEIQKDIEDIQKQIEVEKQLNDQGIDPGGSVPPSSEISSIVSQPPLTEQPQEEQKQKSQEDNKREEKKPEDKKEPKQEEKRPVQELPEITITSLKPATVGTSYFATLSAIKGKPPYKWRLFINSSPLPLGLSVNKSGRIEGTPTKAGTYNFFIEVEDSSGFLGINDMQDIQLFTLVVKEKEPEKPTPPPDDENKEELKPGKETDLKIDVSKVEQVIHSVINLKRLENGMKMLQWDAQLADVARGHSSNMSKLGFNHVLNGCDISCRAKNQDYKYSQIGENIFVLAKTELDEDAVAVQIVNGWMNSEPHRKAILTKDFTHQGIGIFITADNDVYATENLSIPASQPVPVTAPNYDLTKVASDLFDLINTERQKAELKALAWDTTLVQVSKNAVEDIKNNTASECDIKCQYGKSGVLTGSKAQNICNKYSFKSWNVNKEITEYYTQDEFVADIFKTWIERDGQRANILGSYETVGVYVDYNEDTGTVQAVASFYAPPLTSSDKTNMNQVRPVRVVYLVPSNRISQPSYIPTFETVIKHFQAWLRDEMGNGKTIKLSDPIVEWHQTSHDEDWYVNNPNGDNPSYWFWENVLADGFALTGAKFNDPNYAWLFFIDSKGSVTVDAPVWNAGSRGVAMASLRIAPEKEGEYRVKHYCTLVFTAGHELGHAFGLVHPPGLKYETEEEKKLCIEKNFLMGCGYGASRKLLPEEKDLLNQSPYLTFLDLPYRQESFECIL